MKVCIESGRNAPEAQISVHRNHREGETLVASLLLVVRPGAPSSFLFLVANCLNRPKEDRQSQRCERRPRLVASRRFSSLHSSSFIYSSSLISIQQTPISMFFDSGLLSVFPSCSDPPTCSLRPVGRPVDRLVSRRIRPVSRHLFIHQPGGPGKPKIVLLSPCNRKADSLACDWRLRT